MAKNFYTLIDGEPVHVNRRGCKGRWTKKDQEALEALTRAVRAMTPEQIEAASAKTKTKVIQQRRNDESAHRSGVQDHSDAGELPKDVTLAQADHSDSGTRAPATPRTPHGSNAATLGGASASTEGREGSAAASVEDREP